MDKAIKAIPLNGGIKVQYRSCKTNKLKTVALYPVSGINIAACTDILSDVLPNEDVIYFTPRKIKTIPINDNIDKLNHIFKLNHSF